MKYECGMCGASGCKLWREYGTCMVYLACAPCAAKVGNRDISSLDENGTRLMPEYDWAHPGERTDSIGWYVPAVVNEDMDGCWGYTSVPEEAIAAWRKLPSLPVGGRS